MQLPTPATFATDEVRDREIVRRHLAGKSMPNIAYEMCLPYKLVREVVTKLEPAVVKEKRANKTAKTWANALVVAEAPGAHSTVATLRARELLATEGLNWTLRPVSKSKTDRVVVTEATAIAMLQRCASELGVTILSTTMYNKWRTTPPIKAATVSGSELCRHFQWSALVRAAGLANPLREGNAPRWTEAALHAILRDYVTFCIEGNTRPDGRGYSWWASFTTPKPPYIHTFTRHHPFPQWVAKVQAELHQEMLAEVPE